MIKVGVNGVSLGDLNAGVMAGANMLSFVPLHLSAVDCLDGLLRWLLRWTGDNTVVLGESDWPRPHTNCWTYVCSIGVAQGVHSPQAAGLSSCCCDPAFVHFVLAEAVGENGIHVAEDPSWLSCLANGQPRASCTRDLTPPLVQTSPVAF